MIAGLLTRPAVAWAGDCEVTFGFAGDAAVSGIVVRVDYSGGGATIGGKGEAAICRAGANGVLATFNDREGESVLSAALIRVKPFGGTDLFTCAVDGAAASASDFVVTTLDASDAEAQPISPLPAVVVTGVSCGNEQGGGEDEAEQSCEVVFTLESDARVSGLVFEAEYGASGGNPKGAGETVQCETLLDGGVGAYNDEEETEGLIGAIVHVAGVEGLHDLASCTFRSTLGGLDGDAIAVSVTDAVGPTGEPLEIDPAVFVSSVECGASQGEGGGDEGDEGDEDAEEGEDCGGGYDVTFAIGGGAELGAVQLAVDYGNAPGLFSGSGEHVDCDSAVGGFTLFNDQDDLRTLLAGIVSVSGFDTPAALMICRFEAVERAPTAADFTVIVEDVAHPDGSDVEPAPAAYVASIAALDGACGACGEACEDAEGCGNGVVEDGEACDDGNADDGDACLSDCTAPVPCGDTDANGSVTASDAKRTLNEAVGLASDCAVSLCDVNGTGTVTATDARMILNKAVGQDVFLECAPGVFSLADAGARD